MQDTPSPRGKLTHTDWVAIAALVALCLLFFRELAFTNQILPRGDIYLYFYPQWEYRNAALMDWQLPLWNPYLFMGVPFLADIQNGVLYPPNWILAPFNGPISIKIALIGHVLWGAVGTYLYSRKRWHITPISALTAGAVFALGGYIGAQVEHINQLQGLSWLPWLFLLWEQAQVRPRAMLWLLAAWAMVLLTGHTQSAYIMGVGLGLWALADTIRMVIDYRSQSSGQWQFSLSMLWPLGSLAVAAAGSLVLAAAQIIPTMELTQYSNRSGGLTPLDAVSFSFRPQFIGRGFLPSYGPVPLFTEYVIYVGIAGLVIAVLLFLTRWREVRILSMAVLGTAGLFLGFGAYNPAYWLLLRVMPGLDLFRVPARWLVLTAFALAILVGIGIDELGRRIETRPGKSLVLPVGITLFLMGSTFLAPIGSSDIPGAVQPYAIEIAVWLLTLTGTGTLLYASNRYLKPGTAQTSYAALILVELFVASLTMPYNTLMPPEGYSAQRPAISTLIAGQAGNLAPARYLSISDILFEPGDQRELRATFGEDLTENEMLEYLASAKHRDVLSANLSIRWGIPAMDGYGGGLTPLRAFTRYSELMVGEEVPTDGRLRENLDELPGFGWLSYANVGWIITDKLYDTWIGGVYHDLQVKAAALPGGVAVSAAPAVPFEATTISIVGHLLTEASHQPGAQVGSVSVYPVGAAQPYIQPLLYAEPFVTNLTGDFAEAVGSFDRTDPELVEHRITVTWPEAITIERIEISTVSSFDGVIVVRGITLIDERSGAALAATIGGPDTLTLALSGDVKIYQFNEANPRALFTCDVRTVDTEEAGWEALRESLNNPVVVDPGATSISCAGNPGTVAITTYEPEIIRMEVSAPTDGYLILADAWYPGWVSYVDGEPVEVFHANGMFRAVRVPAGEHQVEMSFESRRIRRGLWISAGGISLWLIMIIGLAVRRPRHDLHTG